MSSSDALYSSSVISQWVLSFHVIDMFMLACILPWTSSFNCRTMIFDCEHFQANVFVSYSYKAARAKFVGHFVDREQRISDTSKPCNYIEQEMTCCFKKTVPCVSDKIFAAYSQWIQLIPFLRKKLYPSSSHAMCILHHVSRRISQRSGIS